MDSQMPRTIVPQSGVIPYRIRKGRVEIALVTASSGPHWTIPKGHIEQDMTAPKSAEKEAYEESGLIGRVEKRSVGRYVYEKRGRSRQVEVFPLEVRKELKRWPEMLIRKRRWMSVDEAASRVRSAELRCCLQKFERSLSRMIEREYRAVAA
jgi:8-oxo-dGTP pyrophosphatase MutT (NUDIX family)